MKSGISSSGIDSSTKNSFGNFPAMHILTFLTIGAVGAISWLCYGGTGAYHSQFIKEDAAIELFWWMTLGGITVAFLSLLEIYRNPATNNRNINAKDIVQANIFSIAMGLVFAYSSSQMGWDDPQPWPAFIANIAFIAYMFAETYCISGLIEKGAYFNSGRHYKQENNQTSKE